MFWGLIMEPGKKYSQTVEKSFHVSQAALDLDTAQSECVQVLLGFESRNYLLCTLQKGKWVQSQLDLNFQAGDTVSFATNGPGHVHLTGYLVPEDDIEYMDEEEDEEEVPSLVEVSSKKRKASEMIKKEQGKTGKKSKTELLLEEYGRADTDDSDDSDVNTDALEEDDDDDDSDVADEEDGFSEDDEMDEDDDESEEEEEQIPKAVKSPKQKSPKVATAASPSPKQNGVAKTPKSEKKKQQAAENKTPKQDKQQQKSPKSEKGLKAAASASPAKKAEGGVVIEELKVGDGQQAKSGKYATVYYEGRLKANNKMFDSSTKGPGFRFRLGKQEVIKGWDVGVSGMKVGGKRRITCPPHMAYGAQGSPPVIPPNSTLVFEVELKKLN